MTASGIPSASPGMDASRPFAPIAMAVAGVMVGAIALVAEIGPPHGPIAVTVGCHLPCVLAAWRLAGRCCTAAPSRTGLGMRIAWSILIYISLVVAVTQAIGVAQALSRGSLFTALTAAGILLLALACRGDDSSLHARASSQPTAWAWLPVWMAGSVVVTHGLLHAQYDFDELTYHLFFPARWAQEGAISIVPTWFSDPAPAYAPSASEIYYLSLMLPMRSDHLARCGQIVFWIEIVAVVAALGRELRMRPRAILLATGGVVAIPAIAWQAGTAMVDVALAAHLMAMTLFSLRVARRPNGIDAAGLILAAGLAVGTKFLALPYLAALSPVWGRAVLSSIRSPRQSHGVPARAAGVAGFALLMSLWNGGFWYARNWAVTGNPLFPLEVRLGGQALFDGAFTRAAMLNSPFNHARRGWDGLTDVLGGALRMPPWFPAPSLLSQSMASTIGACSLLVLMLACTVALLGRIRTRMRPALLSINLSVTAMVALFWWVIPFQEPRFTWPMLVLSLVSILTLMDGMPRRWRGIPTGVFGVAWIGLSADAWASTFATRASTVAVGAVLVAFVLHARARRTAMSMMPALCIAAVWLGLWSVARDGDLPRQEARRHPRWAGFGDAWAWVDTRVAHATIAYAGHNVPYFLTGPHQQNRVVHILAGGGPNWAYHNFARDPVVKAMGHPNVSDFAPNRIQMDGWAWLQELRREGVTLVVVTRLFRGVCVSHRHDADGFPLERQWLDLLAQTRGSDGKPLARRGVFGQGWLLIYHLNLPASESEWPELERVMQDETDALDRRRRDGTLPGARIDHYPLAADVIESLGLKQLP